MACNTSRSKVVPEISPVPHKYYARALLYFYNACHKSKIYDTMKKQIGNAEDRRKGMEYRTATPDMADGIYNVLHTAIKTIYPKYYPKEVADFFCRHHSKEHILEGIASGNMGVLLVGNRIVGTGCFDGAHITGVYVLPDYQKKGCGTYIMDCLEGEIAKKHDTAVLDASFPAASLYEHRGYKTVGHGVYELDNDVKLVYEIMEKNLE